MSETLNLVNPKDSLSCKYEISKFPDGQQSLKVITPINEINKHVTIKSRFNSIKIGKGNSSITHSRLS